MTLGSVPEAIAALRTGRPVIVVDDEARENEGDAVMAAECATQPWVAWMVRHTSGYLCAPLPDALADHLNLPLMVARNEDERGTNYTVSVDAADRSSTGISAAERAHTLRVLADPESTAASLIRPGHILPLRAAAGGVLERAGHTEATVDLLRLAGLRPVGVIGEIVAEDGEMMRLPELLAFGAREELIVLTIAELAAYLREHEGADGPNGAPEAGPAPVPHDEPELVSFTVDTLLPTRHGTFRVRAYRDRSTGSDHLALISPPQPPGAGEQGVTDTAPAAATLVRVHSECLTGEALGSLRCECGPQLDAALAAVAAHGGVVVYLRGHEGRGIGLTNKLRAYQLQDDGLDTLDANLALGLPADARSFAAAGAILRDLGITTVRLLTNNPEKATQIAASGIRVQEQLPLVVGVGSLNHQYLDTKRLRFGHTIHPDALVPTPPEPPHGEDTP